MAYCKNAVTPLLTNWIYCGLALSHRYAVHMLWCVESRWIGVTLFPDADLCAKNPCKHDGKCLNNGNGYLCECADGFSGPHCERSKSSRDSVLNPKLAFWCIDTSFFYIDNESWMYIWINNYIPVKLWNVIPYTCRHFNTSWTEPPLI